MYGEGKNFVMGRLEQPRQAEQKLKEPTKEGPFSFVLFESPFTSVSTVSTGHPFLVSLISLHLFPIVQQAGQAVVPRRLSLNMCLCSQFPHSHLPFMSFQSNQVLYNAVHGNSPCTLAGLQSKYRRGYPTSLLS